MHVNPLSKWELSSHGGYAPKRLYHHYRYKPPRRKVVLGVALLAVLTGLTSSAPAGGGPENVLLVVNEESESSKTVANHYVRMRRIPESNVLFVRWRGGVETCQVESFRRVILKPILNAINERRLAMQIDYVIYSCDFPWRVDMQKDFPEKNFPPEFRPVASLTGATYLWQYVEVKHPHIVATLTNWYCGEGSPNNSLQCVQLGRRETRAFRYLYLWTRSGNKTHDAGKGQHYLMSVMLGVTSGRGNTVDEVVSYLRRSTWADATHPDGTFYFAQNSGIRSQQRHKCFPEVVARLEQLGERAQVVQGKMPAKRADVLGIVSGTANCNLDRAHCTLLPGAICDNLTSLGGVLKEGVGQTPVSEFLRHGAAGAVGTVIEPYAIQAKFPLPDWPVHYVQGCSLAESLYQSIAAPYQLLIVGDPLCQPWAVPPTVTVDGIASGDEVRGKVTFKPAAHTVAGRNIRYYEIYMDGVMQARYQTAADYTLDTTEWDDGYHEMRIVAVDSSPMECQGRIVFPIFIRNHDSAIEFSVTPTGNVPADSVLRLSARQPGARAITLFHQGREIGNINGEAGEVEIPARSLGRGPVALSARSTGEQPAVAAPIWRRIE